MTAYVRSGLQLAKRRRVLAGAEARLRAALARGAVVARDVERVRDAQLAFLKALRYELETGTDVDAASEARRTEAERADRAWRAAADSEIVAAYASGPGVAPADVPATFSAATDPIGSDRHPIGRNPARGPSRSTRAG